MNLLLTLAGIVGVLALTAGTALFVAAEFSLTALERSTVDAHAEGGDARALQVQHAHRTLSFQLSGAQLGITITTLVTGYIAEPVLAGFLRPAFDALGLGQGVSDGISLVLALVIATSLSMVFGELVAKNLAIARPLATARLTAGPQAAFSRVFRRLISLLNGTANRLVRRLGVEPAEELRSARSPQELGSLVRTSARQGSLDEGTAALLDRSLRFGERSADELMTPRVRIETLGADETVDDLLAAARRTGFSRFPVVQGDLDDPLGVVHVKQAFAIPDAQRASTTLDRIVRRVPTVPATLDGDALMDRVRGDGLQVALVVDEYGGTAGMVTMEDLIEEIVGDVRDEHDATDVDVRRVDSGWDLSGLLRVDEVTEATGFTAPEGEYETLGGVVQAHLGRVPAAGDVLHLDGWSLSVQRMDGRRVDVVRLTPEPGRPTEGVPTVGDLLAVALAVVLLAGNAFFVGAEFALITARRDRLETLEAQGRRGARTVIEAGEQLSLMLAGAQLGITICSILLGRVGEPAVAHLIEVPMGALGVPEALLHPIAFTLALALVVVLHILLGEMVPKNIAIAGPERSALLLVPAHLAFVRAARPVIGVYNWSASRILHSFGVEAKDELDTAYTPGELAGMIAESRSEGMLDAQEHRRLTQALTTRGRTVSEVVIPLGKVRSLPHRELGPTLGALEEAVAETGFSRYPVRLDDGTFTGYLHVKDLLDAVLDDGAGPGTVIPADRVRDLPSVPSSDHLDVALAGLRRASAHLGRVVDATGTTVGLVTLEDLVEEFVGTVRDATHRQPDRTP